MKNVKLLCASILICFAMTVKAQDCYKLVSPNFSEEVYNNTPADKLDFYCKFAQAAFYKTNTLPANAIVYPISAVVNKRTNENLSQSVQINLDTFSVYAYNFDTFRYRHWKKEVFFETSDTVNRYLVLRTEGDMYDIATEMLNSSQNVNKNRKNSNTVEKCTVKKCNANK